MLQFHGKEMSATCFRFMKKYCKLQHYDKITGFRWMNEGLGMDLQETG